jgi:hypothetical protein
MSGCYACRTGNDLRFFGNYRIRQGDRILTFATRRAKQLSRDLKVGLSAGLQQNNGQKTQCIALIIGPNSENEARQQSQEQK